MLARFDHQDEPVLLESMEFPETVISMAINPKSHGDRDKMGESLSSIAREDPTFRAMSDEETNETVIAGMGELHLEVYIERIRREYGVEVEVGAPKVSYRESATTKYEFDHKRKKQTGGSGQYGHIVGVISPMTDEDREEAEGGELLAGGRRRDERGRSSAASGAGSARSGGRVDQKSEASLNSPPNCSPITPSIHSASGRHSRDRIDRRVFRRAR